MLVSAYLGMVLTLNRLVSEMIQASDEPGRAAVLWGGLVFVPLDALPFVILAVLRPISAVGISVCLAILFATRIMFNWNWSERWMVWASRIWLGIVFNFFIFVRFVVIMREVTGHA